MSNSRPVKLIPKLMHFTKEQIEFFDLHSEISGAEHNRRAMDEYIKCYVELEKTATSPSKKGEYDGRRIEYQPSPAIGD